MSGGGGWSAAAGGGGWLAGGAAAVDAAWVGDGWAATTTPEVAAGTCLGAGTSPAPQATSPHDTRLVVTRRDVMGPPKARVEPACQRSERWSERSWPLTCGATDGDLTRHPRWSRLGVARRRRPGSPAARAVRPDRARRRVCSSGCALRRRGPRGALSQVDVKRSRGVPGHQGRRAWTVAAPVRQVLALHLRVPNQELRDEQDEPAV